MLTFSDLSIFFSSIFSPILPQTPSLHTPQTQTTHTHTHTHTTQHTHKHTLHIPYTLILYSLLEFSDIFTVNCFDLSELTLGSITYVVFCLLWLKGTLLVCPLRRKRACGDNGANVSSLHIPRSPYSSWPIGGICKGLFKRLLSK